MNEAQKKALLESIKEPIRLLILAVLPVGITMLSGVNAIWAVIATLILRAIDRYLHIAGKAEAGVKGKGQSFGIIKI